MNPRNASIFVNVSQNTNFLISGDSGSSSKMAILDVVLGVFRVVVFVYDVITFPIYALAQQKWKDRTKQDLGKVSQCLNLLKYGLKISLIPKIRFCLLMFQCIPVEKCR